MNSSKIGFPLTSLIHSASSVSQILLVLVWHGITLCHNSIVSSLCFVHNSATCDFPKHKRRYRNRNMEIQKWRAAPNHTCTVVHFPNQLLLLFRKKLFLLVLFTCVFHQYSPINSHQRTVPREYLFADYFRILKKCYVVLICTGQNDTNGDARGGIASDQEQFYFDNFIIKYTDLVTQKYHLCLVLFFCHCHTQYNKR